MSGRRRVIAITDSAHPAPSNLYCMGVAVLDFSAGSLRRCSLCMRCAPRTTMPSCTSTLSSHAQASGGRHTHHCSPLSSVPLPREASICLFSRVPSLPTRGARLPHCPSFLKPTSGHALPACFLLLRDTLQLQRASGREWTGEKKQFLGNVSFSPV